MPYGTMVDRLGRIFYNAYKPIRNINGQIVGMLSVGTPANQLFEETRQQLLTIFLLVTFLALLAGMIAYRAVMSTGGKKKAGAPVEPPAAKNVQKE